jgi:hypothetical protein
MKHGAGLTASSRLTWGLVRQATLGSPTKRMQATAWVGAMAPLLFPQAKSFALDFHPIPFRGEATGLQQHYLPKRGKAGTSVLSFFAQEQESRVLCYANANLTRRDQAGEAMRFVEFLLRVTLPLCSRLSHPEGTRVTLGVTKTLAPDKAQHKQCLSRAMWLRPRLQINFRHSPLPLG